MLWSAHRSRAQLKLRSWSNQSKHRHGILTFEQGVKPGADLLSLPGRPTATACSADLQALGSMKPLAGPVHGFRTT